MIAISFIGGAKFRIVGAWRAMPFFAHRIDAYVIGKANLRAWRAMPLQAKLTHMGLHPSMMRFDRIIGLEKLFDAMLGL